MIENKLAGRRSDGGAFALHNAHRYCFCSILQKETFFSVKKQRVKTFKQLFSQKKKKKKKKEKARGRLIKFLR